MLSLLVIGLLALAPTDPNPLVDEYWEKSIKWLTNHRTSLMRVEITTPGGPLPFMIEFDNTLISASQPHDDGSVIHPAPSPDARRSYNATIRNGSESKAAVMRIVQGGIGGPARAWVNFPEYNSEITTSGTGDCTRPSTLPRHFLRWGDWAIQRTDGPVQLELTAYPTADINDRFDPIPDAGDPAPFAGRWAVDFGSTDDPAVGVFEVNADQIATGTFLTPTGDYRYLAGRVDGDLMRLSTFDGAHAFLFHARMQEDGAIAGDFWSGNWHHETWTAAHDDDARLPDAFTQTRVADPAAVDALVFKALDGTPTKVTGLLDASGAKARIIEIFGSWCPNCADAGAEMRRLKDTFDDDLAIVGFAFERTEDFARAARQVRTYTDRFNADWPVLIAGLSDKAKASAELPILDKVRAYPTTIFLNADNEIVAIHTGFNGPATGDEHAEQQAEFERIIRGLITE